MFQNLQILKEERNGMLVTTNVFKTLRYGIWGGGGGRGTGVGWCLS